MTNVQATPPRVAVSARLRGTERILTNLRCEPLTDLGEALVGGSLLKGHRGRVAEMFRSRSHAGGLQTMLEDLPTAAVLVEAPHKRSAADRYHFPPLDVCAGWRTGGTLHRTSAAGGAVIVGEASPSPGDADEAVEWPDEPPSPRPLTVRRRRRTEVWADSAEAPTVRAELFLRDAIVELDRSETILHEYCVVLSIDARSRLIREIRIEPHVLPAVDCCAAAQSADDLVGLMPDDVRPAIATMRGPTTCTHLTDVLRSVGDLASVDGVFDPPDTKIMEDADAPWP